MLLVIVAKNLKVTLSIVLLSYFNKSNGLPELQMNLPSFMGYFNNSVTVHVYFFKFLLFSAKIICENVLCTKFE